MEYKRTFTELEEKILLNDLLDITKWIDGMIDGKIHNCLTRLASQEKQRLIDGGAKTVPVKLEEFAISAFANKDYQSRLQREQRVSL